MCECGLNDSRGSNVRPVDVVRGSSLWIARSNFSLSALDHDWRASGADDDDEEKKRGCEEGL